jgi:hypothetical protein
VRSVASPYSRLQRALDRGLLELACEVARECEQLDHADSLRLCLLMQQAHDERFERAAVRWLGRLLVDHPEIGLDLAHQAMRGARDLASGAHDVGRAELAVVLRAAGEIRAAESLER